MAAVAIGATIIAGSVKAQTRAIQAGVAAEVGRERATGIAATFARPGLTTRLAMLETHLPRDLALVSAEQTRTGVLRITIDSADPDQLRAAFAGDPWLAGFRQSAQEQQDDGMFRVTLKQPATKP